MATGKLIGYKKIAFLSVLTAWAAFADNVVTNTFKMTAANTPLTAYDYETLANWNDQSLGAPMGGEARATFKAADNGAASPYFVKVPENFKTTQLTLGKGTFLLGDYLKVNSQQTSTYLFGNTNYPYGGIIFGDLKITKLYPTGSRSYINDIEIAGHIQPGDWDGGSDGAQNYAHTASVVLRHDLFADSADAVRPRAYEYTYEFPENGGFTVYGPKGAPTNDSSWNLTAGEVYLEYAGAGDHAVVPGQVVTGAGVPPGTFVRYVFPGTKWIALSAPATTTVSAATLHFDAITPSVTEYWPKYLFQGSGGRIWALAKFREEDCLKMVVGLANFTDNGNETRLTRIGLDADQARAGFIPGDMVITNTTFDSTVKIRPIHLRNCRLEIVNPFTWDSSALDQFRGPTGIRFELDSGCVAEIKIPAGKEVDLKAFCNLQGTLVKKGGGTLVVPLFNACDEPTGTVDVVEGTLDLRRAESISDQLIHLDSLKIASGATFVVPAGGLTVTSLDAMPGSVISGGTLTVLNRPVNALPIVTGGAGLRFRFGLTAAEVFPAASLRLHFDASVASSIITNSAGGITRWDDLSGSGDYLVNNNRGSKGAYATNRVNVANGLPMVDLGPLCWTNEGPGMATEKDRSLYLKKSDGNLYTKSDADNGVLSFANCQTALCVIDSRYGGGPLIGQYGISAYPQYSPFPCGIRDSADWEDQRNARYYSHTDKKNGNNWWGGKYTDSQLSDGTLIFRVNGVSGNPCTTKFTGGFEIVSYAYENRQYGCFGLGCWGDGAASSPRTANGLMYGEVVIFSNKLSLAQIELAERFLKHKWMDVDDPVFYHLVTAGMIALGEGATLSGINGRTFATSALSGVGTVAGDLALEDGATISVATDANGMIVGSTVAGTLTLGSSLHVSVGGTVKPEIGVYRICSANAVEGVVNASLLTVTPFPGDSRPYAVVVDSEGVVLKIKQSGFCLIFR